MTTTKSVASSNLINTYPNAKEYGATATGAIGASSGTDDTAAIQALLTAVKASGGTAVIPSGVYRISSAELLLDYTSATTGTIFTKQVNISGRGHGNTVLIADYNNHTALRIIGDAAGGFGSDGWYKLSDFEIMLGTASNVNGLTIQSSAYFNLSNIRVQGMANAFVLDSVVSCNIDNCHLSNNTYGIVLYSTGFSYNNAVTISNSRIISNSYCAVAGGNATSITFNSCNFEENGTHGVSVKGGVDLVFNGLQGTQGATFDSCWFENNGGGFDVNLTNEGTKNVVTVFKNCGFYRVSGTNYVTNNIRAVCTGGAGTSQTLVFMGCTFGGYNAYTANVARLMINTDANVTVYLIGCTFTGSSTADQPLVGGIGTGTLINVGAGGGGGGVSTVSVVPANGLSGTVANPTTTPAITLTTSITGVLKGNGTAISAATSGTDYSPGTSALASGIVKSTTTTGALSIAAVGSDYCAATSGSSILKGTGTGGTTAANSSDVISTLGYTPVTTTFPGWTAVSSFSNSWVNLAGGACAAGYYKDPQGVVHLRGAIKSGTLGAKAFTLPAGYYSTTGHMSLPAMCSGPAAALISIDYTNGDVIPTGGNNTYITLDGITFQVA